MQYIILLMNLQHCTCDGARMVRIGECDHATSYTSVLLQEYTALTLYDSIDNTFLNTVRLTGSTTRSTTTLLVTLVVTLLVALVVTLLVTLLK